MKSLKLTAAAAFAGMLILFAGCSKEQSMSVAPNAAESMAYDLVDFNELAAPQVTDGVAEEFKVRDAQKHFDRTPCDGPAPKEKNGMRDDKGGKKPEAKDPKRDLGAVLHKLDLNKEQKQAIQKYMHEHCLCIAEHLKKVNEVNRQIIARYNAKRDELLKAAKDGRISKEELGRRLQELKGQLDKELNSEKNKQVHMEIMKKCEDQFLHNIASVLNEKQQAVFRKWLASR
jgi:hypothetical protein